MVQTTLGIDGMQCEMCEAHVNEAIRKAFPEIKEVRSSHRKKTTRILSNEVIDEAALRSVIAATGYELEFHAVVDLENSLPCAAAARLEHIFRSPRRPC